MLQELTNKIKKIIPEIEELKEGCVLSVQRDRLFQGDAFINEKWVIVGFKSKYPNLKLFLARREYSTHNTKTIECIEKIGEEVDWQYHSVKIIGRPITLEDVLRCLGKALNSSYQIRDTGEILIMGIPSDIYWDLGKPLHEQSEETIKELNKLIMEH